MLESGLRGRGGAGFPTGRKWQGVADHAASAETATFLVCNGAEGEPGTYKDRTLLEHNPYAVLEGMLIGMHAVGASEGFVGIKEKFTTALEATVRARDELVAAGWHGADRLHVVPGPDEYLFGEEKALLEVIEGKQPMPRILPPYEQGLFATVASPNPTVVNNVETFAHVAAILAHGTERFRAAGTDTSPGTMLFTVTGDVASPGVYELPLGTPLRSLLVDIAGAEDVGFVFSGTSNTVILPSQLDTPMDFDALAEVGTGLGSGGFVVYDRDRCVVRVLTVLQRFLAIESCGQCMACKLGTQQIWEGLDAIERGEADADVLSSITDRVPTIIDQARCYLPTGSQLLVGSTLEHFWDRFVAHLGTTCSDDRPVPTPLIESIDEDAGTVHWHPTYHRKQLDWSYAD